MFEVLEASGLVTIQDGGRTGWRRFGVPVSGAMDEYALQAANVLVGNPPNAAALEIGGGELALQAIQDQVLAVAGAGYDLTVNIWTYPMWGSFLVRRGWTIRLRKIEGGMWAYLAGKGGFEAESVLGSRATYLRGHFGGLGGRGMQPGDILRCGVQRGGLMESSGWTVSEEARPNYDTAPTVEVILGPQSEAITEDSLQAWLSTAYRVSAASDRMGYRLEGPALTVQGHGDFTSEGMTSGAVQVTSGGTPIVMMADSATAGGYPKIACVIRADLPLLAQCRPGKDEVRFRQTTVEAAQEKYRAKFRKLGTGILQMD